MSVELEKYTVIQISGKSKSELAFVSFTLLDSL